MTYEQANGWFKRWHEENHRETGVPLAAANCAALGYGHMWSRVIREYQRTPA